MSDPNEVQAVVEEKTPAIVAEMRELAKRLVDGFEKLPGEYRHDFEALKAKAEKHV